MASSWIEWTAVVTGVLCVIFNTRNSVWGWPTGLISVGLYIYVFFAAKLYADTLLQVYFVATGIYGWHQWLHGGQAHHELPITRLSRREWLQWMGLGLAGSVLLGFLFDTYTDAALPWPDSFVTAFSFIAQFLLARRKLENWIFWLAVDVAAIGVYWAKDLKPTALLYLIYLGLASYGLVHWRQLARRTESNPKPL
ncbi:MAG: nicotinamide riboside transporter PnuC [Bacteroidia bacterium]|nr:nicotinamide riboside transporter PnuC [Bacteroidia bacterium]